MEDIKPVHEIELYPAEIYEVLLNHEIRRARRNTVPLTLMHIALETEGGGAHAQHGAEIYAINVLNLHIRDTDIPTRNENEFYVLMPDTDEEGSRKVCERMYTLFQRESQVYEKVEFKLHTYLGLASHPGGSTISKKELISNADQALAQARRKKVSSFVYHSELDK